LVGCSSCDSDDKYTAGGSYVLMPKLKRRRKTISCDFDTGAYQDALASHHCCCHHQQIDCPGCTIKIARKRENADAIGKMLVGMR